MDNQTWFDATLVYRLNKCNQRSYNLIIKSVNQSSTRVASNHVLQCHVARQQALESRIEEENREGSRVLLLGRGRQRRA